jgi:hypothetical protein
VKDDTARLAVPMTLNRRLGYRERLTFPSNLGNAVGALAPKGLPQLTSGSDNAIIGGHDNDSRHDLRR